MDDSFISQTLFSGPFATVQSYQTGSTNEKSGIMVERHKCKPSSGIAKSSNSYGGSCKVCRMKKIKCDRRTPCSNCLKSKKHCLYVSSSRVRRRSRDDNLEQSIQKLNEIVKNIEKSQSGVPIGSRQTLACSKFPDSGVTLPSGYSGRLLIRESRSRYTSDRFWGCLADEANEMRELLKSSSLIDHESPIQTDKEHTSLMNSFPFSIGRSRTLLRKFHPPFEKAKLLWNFFVQNIAPLVPILHKATAANMIWETCREPQNVSEESEALILTIYLSAVISLTPEQCFTLLQVSREACVKKFGYAVEQALTGAGLLQTDSFIVLQAAVLYLTCIRQEDPSKFTSALISVVLRIAQRLGLHRDGETFELSIFETEMRRRLWWHIYILDVRSSEDEIIDRQINSMMFDTHFPSNLNDDDIFPEMDELPETHDRFTEMTFFLMRCEILVAFTPKSPTFSLAEISTSVTGGETYNQFKRRLGQKYIEISSSTIPLQWVCRTLAQLMLAKFWLLAQCPMKRHGVGGCIHREAPTELFYVSLDVIKYCCMLMHHPGSVGWRWMFISNPQWHAIALVLSELCVLPTSPITDQAWRLIDDALHPSNGYTRSRKALLWQPLLRLMERARTSRRSREEAAGTRCSNTVSSMFQESGLEPALQFDSAFQCHKKLGNPDSWMVPRDDMFGSPNLVENDNAFTQGIFGDSTITNSTISHDQLNGEEQESSAYAFLANNQRRSWATLDI